MIDTVLQAITRDLNAFLARRFTKPKQQDWVVLSELAGPDGKPVFSANLSSVKIYCTLLNIEYEQDNVNVRPARTAITNPPIRLNLCVLFSVVSAPENYREALRLLSFLMGFFQGKQIFTSANTPELSSNLDKITVEHINVNIQEMNNLWTALGVKHLPAALYRFRMISITEDTILEEVTSVTGISTRQKPS